MSICNQKARERIGPESELNIAYERSAIVAGPVGGGHRLPGHIRLRDLVGDVTGHTVLVIARDATLASEIRNAVAADHLETMDASAILNPDDHPSLREVTDADVAIVTIRPDGYIGRVSIGADAGPVGEYFELVRSGGR